MRRFRLVAVGGTFDTIHKGHRKLLDKALEIGEHVIIGVTTDSFVEKTGKPYRVKPHVERVEALRRYLESKVASDRFEVVPIDDPYGPTLTSLEMEALVVSDETYRRAVEINRLREARGLKPLKIIKVGMVLADDGKPISTTRIRLGEIDEEGRLKANLLK